MKTVVLILLFVEGFAQANDIECRLGALERDSIQLVRVSDNFSLAEFDSVNACARAVEASRGGVVCAWFTPSMPVGPGGWVSTGWRPMNIETGIGLGRLTIASFENCLSATKNASGNIVCTYTGIAFKPTHIETNMWCGSSAELEFCAVASAQAVDGRTCSFPSSGSGAEAGWVRTIIGVECEYMGNKLPVDRCMKSWE